ncbi:MAG: GNAT family N-acetyltransferase [Cryomorphaceae bacterium]
MADRQVTEINFKTVPFNGLSLMDLHDMLKLRTDIFVVEQNCPYPEIDGKDPECLHTLGFTPSGALVAGARIVPSGVIYDDVSIGRVVVRSDYRGQALGKRVMLHAMIFCKNTLKADTVKIAAQHYLEGFYNALGFETTSEIYPWDGIDHIDMVWKNS